MTARKHYLSAAIDRNGAVLGTLTVATRKLERAALEQCILWCAGNGGGWFRRQTEGARGWGYYNVAPGASEGLRLSAEDAAPVAAMFDALGPLAQNVVPEVKPAKASALEWKAEGWEAEFHAGFLVVTNPEGGARCVQLRRNGRLNTLQEFRSSVASHGVLKACQVFWKLAA